MPGLNKKPITITLYRPAKKKAIHNVCQDLTSKLLQSLCFISPRNKASRNSLATIQAKLWFLVAATQLYTPHFPSVLVLSYDENVKKKSKFVNGDRLFFFQKRGGALIREGALIRRNTVMKWCFIANRCGCHGNTFLCNHASVSKFCEIFWGNIVWNRICFNFPTINSVQISLVWRLLGSITGLSHSYTP